LSIMWINQNYFASVAHFRISQNLTDALLIIFFDACRKKVTHHFFLV